MRISLFCNAGMSTSLVASKLKESFEKIGKNYDVEAFDFSNLGNEADDTDVIVLGPQIAWAFDEVEKEYPDKKVILLSLQEFGSMNGDVIRERLEKEI
ncbi:PTS sugar transporter subunit IIB [Enterococcus sp. AZ196]|uniref:PTS sugar transporter subunit IIB n=1 Tax=Enterococcus sp. AZ196 TaxID=2774659 RepID=UPI003D2AE2B7